MCARPISGSRSASTADAARSPGGSGSTTRIVDEPTFDAFGLLLAADAFAPVCFQFPEITPGHAPTLELTVHVRGTPAPGPLRCRFTSRFLQQGLFEEDGEIWDASGKLVAQSRQLALIPRPAG